MCHAWQFVFNQDETGSVWAATKNIIYAAQPNAPVDFPSFFRECIVYSNINTHLHTHSHSQTHMQRTFTHVFVIAHVIVISQELQLDAVLIATEIHFARGCYLTGALTVS